MKLYNIDSIHFIILIIKIHFSQEVVLTYAIGYTTIISLPQIHIS